MQQALTNHATENMMIRCRYKANAAIMSLQPQRRPVAGPRLPKLTQPLSVLLALLLLPLLQKGARRASNRSLQVVIRRWR